MRFESCGQAKSSEFDTKEDARLLERDIRQNEILMEDKASTVYPQLLGGIVPGMWPTRSSSSPDLSEEVLMP